MPDLIRSPKQMQALTRRCIGPPRGECVAVAGHPTHPMTAYFGLQTQPTPVEHRMSLRRISF